MPKTLKGDIVSHRIIRGECDDCYDSFIVKLKNAKAFGHRLKSIEYRISYAGEWIKPHFYDDTFMQLLPKFTLSGKDVKIKPNQKVAYLATTDGYRGKILSYKQVAYPKDLYCQDEGCWRDSLTYADTPQLLYVSTPTGWDIYGLEMFTLHFDKQEKSISCDDLPDNRL